MQPESDSKGQSFEDLYNLFYVPVFRYAYGQLKNKEEAENIAQSVFLKVFEYNALDNYRELAISYFFTIAKNKIIDHYKKKKEIVVDFASEQFVNIPDGSVNMQAEMEKEEESLRTLQMLDCLNIQQREVIMLKFLGELRNDEISEVVGKSEEAVRQIQSRALKRMRDSLTQVQ